MIGKLKGIIDDILEETLILDVGGVGYEVWLSTKAMSCVHQGDPLSLYILTHVREDHIQLYGFLSALEKETFTRLTGVQGIGSKMALSILSAFAPAELYRIIATGDQKTLTQANGVGAKLANRLVTELKDKVGGFILSAGLPHRADSVKEDAGPGVLEETLSALLNLGYRRVEAVEAAHKSFHEDPAATTNALIRSSLRYLSKKTSN